MTELLWQPLILQLVLDLFYCRLVLQIGCNQLHDEYHSYGTFESF